MSKKWMAALAVPALAVTGVSVASAQTADEDITTEDSTTEEHGHRGPRLFGAVAEAMGIEASELKDALESGQTVADVAAANGVDIDQIIADLVAEAQVRADENGFENFDAAQLTERLTAAANGEGDFGRRGPGHHRGARGSSEAVETLLGLEGEDIRDALREGQTLAEVAEGQGVSLDDLVSTIVDDIENRIEESGRELPDDFSVEDLEERITERVTSERPERGERGRRGGPRGFGPGGQNGGADTEAESTGV